MATGNDVADIAEQVVAARRRGLTSFKVGKVTLNLTESGMCARFVRQCHEAAMGQGEQTWPYRGDRALAVNANLLAAGLGVGDRRRGDVICFVGGEYGHIVIWLGDGMVAENTISGKRGNPRDPGTKITPLVEIGTARIIGWYRPLPMCPPAIPVVPDAGVLTLWETHALEWGMTLGVTDGTRPHEKATRVEVVEMLRRLQQATHAP